VAAAFATAQAFDEPGYWRAWFDPETNKLALRNKAAVPAREALHQNERARAIHHMARWHDVPDTPNLGIGFVGVKPFPALSFYSFVLSFSPADHMLRFAIASALRRAPKLVPALRQGLSEEEVADDVVHQLQKHGDPWGLSQELPSSAGKAHSTPPMDKG
jgi:hypothetical protein